MTKYPDIRFVKDVAGEKLDWFRIVEPCAVRDSSGNLLFTIPAGYVTDFASVPRIFWAIIPPHGRMANASTVHDYMYENGILTRKVADRLFLINCIRDRVPAWQAVLVYYVIRAFGRYKK